MFIGADNVANFAGGLTWVSLPKNTDRFDWIAGSIFSDQAGTLHIEQSGNVVWMNPNEGTGALTFTANWDIDDQIVVTASTPAKLNNVTILNPWIRLRFVATSSTPTVFRLYGKLGAGGDS